MKVLLLGDSCEDEYIYGRCNRMSPEAPVPVLRVTEEEMKLGMAANICHNIYSLGGKSSLASIVGDDSDSEDESDTPSENGNATAVLPERCTGYVSILNVSNEKWCLFLKNQ